MSKLPVPVEEVEEGIAKAIQDVDFDSLHYKVEGINPTELQANYLIELAEIKSAFFHNAEILTVAQKYGITNKQVSKFIQKHNAFGTSVETKLEQLYEQILLEVTALSEELRNSQNTDVSGYLQNLIQLKGMSKALNYERALELLDRIKETVNAGLEHKITKNLRSIGKRKLHNFLKMVKY